MHRSERLAAAVLALLLVTPPPARSQVADLPIARELDALFTAAFAPDEPGAAVLVRRGDEVLLRKGYGLADLEQGIDLTPDMAFRLGSITKQFTAAAVLLLEREGKIDLQAPITRYLPDYPAATGDKVTVEHLLRHTSGVPSYTNEAGWLELVIHDMTVEQMVARWQDKPLEFEPGSKWSYSNSGYFLLGAIIEKAAGTTYEEFLETRIFAPLAMGASDYDRHGRIIPRRVRGYQRGEKGFENAPYLSMSQPYAAGSLMSTVDDLARWDLALRRGELLPKATLERAWTAGALANGKSTAYGYGWAIAKLAGQRVVHHSGGIHGFSTMAVHVPEQAIFVVVLANEVQPQPSAGYLAQAATSALLGQPWKLEPQPVAAETLAEYVAVYRVDAELTRVVTIEDGVLQSQRSGGQRLALVPLGKDEFGVESSHTRFRFERGADGKPSHLVTTPWGGEPERAPRTDEPIPEPPTAAKVDPAIYDTYAGRYELAPGFVLTMRREGEKLIGQATGQGPFEVFPESETVFVNGAIGAKLTFVRGESGAIGMLVLEQAGQRIEGKRLE